MDCLPPPGDAVGGRPVPDVLLSVWLGLLSLRARNENRFFSLPPFCFKVSKIAPDWATKGFHVHVDSVELALRPGQGGLIVLKPVFSSTPTAALSSAVGKMQNALGDLAARQHLYRQAIRARGYLRALGTKQATDKAGELTFFLHALEKLGVQ